jgi:hypothetical protein
MKLSEILDDPGRHIANFPRLRQIKCSINATILLCQLIYWTGKERDKTGRIFKRAYISNEESEGPKKNFVESRTATHHCAHRRSRWLSHERGTDGRLGTILVIHTEPSQQPARIASRLLDARNAVVHNNDPDLRPALER